MPGQTTRHPERRNSGFTLIEAIFAMTIFIVGLVAIASLFPLAARMQQQASDAVVADQVSTSARSLLRMRGIDEAALVSGLPSQHTTSGLVYPLPLDMLVEGDSATYPAEIRWTPESRSYPHTVSLDQRETYWVPLVRLDPGADVVSTADDQWFVYVFILKNRTHLNFDINPTPVDSANPDDPSSVQVVSIQNVSRSDLDTFESAELASMVNVGDEILDELGTIYRVARVEGTQIDVFGFISDSPSTRTIWIGRPDQTGNRGPTLRVLVFSGALIPVIR